MSLVTSSAANNSAVVWNPADYAAHSDAQLAWARELIAQLHLRGDEHVLDVGCGDGKVTAELARSVTRGAVAGIDSSPEMIRFARSQYPQLDFRLMDARQILLPESFDVIYSNATLHWLDDHQAFLRGAAACLKPGGRLVVSCGGKGNAQDMFTALRATMRLKRWKECFRRMSAPYFFHSPEDYAKWLPRVGFETRFVRLADKLVLFSGRGALAAWLRTTWLPYTQRVPELQREDFIEEVMEHYVEKHSGNADGQIPVRMVRLEIDAVKKRQ